MKCVQVPLKNGTQVPPYNAQILMGILSRLKEPTLRKLVAVCEGAKLTLADSEDLKCSGILDINDFTLDELTINVVRSALSIGADGAVTISSPFAS